MYKKRKSCWQTPSSVFWGLVLLALTLVAGTDLLVMLAQPLPGRLPTGGGALAVTAEVAATPEPEEPLPLSVVTTATPVPAVTPAPTVTPTPTPADPAERLYQNLYDQIDDLEQTLTFTETELTTEEVEGVLQRLQYQPEFFWLDGYTYFVQGSDYQVECNWKYTDPAALRPQVEEAAAQALAILPADAQDYDKALLLHDWLCDHIVYQYSQDGSDQDLYGALVNGQCVCAGYSAAYEYLLRQAGVEAETVRGTADNGTNVESHAWTKLVLDGEIYYTDVTWDDHEDFPDGHNYSWFALTSDQMDVTHFADPTLGAEVTPSSAVACNYHHRNGLVLDRFDTEALADILAAQSGDSLTVMAADETIYWQLVDLLQDSAATVDLLDRTGHSANLYTYFTATGNLCVDIFPGM